MPYAIVAVSDPDEAVLLGEILAEEEIAVRRPEVDGSLPGEVPLAVFTDVGAVYELEGLRAMIAGLRERWSGAPVVLLTAHRRAQEDTAALDADAVILKPYDIEDVLGAARSLAFSSR